MPTYTGSGVPAVAKLRRKPVGLRARQRRDRRDAAEELVVVRHFLDSLRRDAAAAQDVGQERPHVGGALRPAERNHQHGIEGRARSSALYWLAARPYSAEPLALVATFSSSVCRVRLAARLGQPLHRHGQRDGLPAAPAVPHASPRRRRDVARRHRGGCRSRQQRPQDRLRSSGRSWRRAEAAGARRLRALRRRAAAHCACVHLDRRCCGLRFTDRLGKGIRGAPRDAMLAHFAAAYQSRPRLRVPPRDGSRRRRRCGPLVASLFLYFYPGDIARSSP